MIWQSPIGAFDAIIVDFDVEVDVGSERFFWPRIQRSGRIARKTVGGNDRAMPQDNITLDIIIRGFDEEMTTGSASNFLELLAAACSTL
jgi:hypothetical protein